MIPSSCSSSFAAAAEHPSRAARRAGTSHGLGHAVATPPRRAAGSAAGRRRGRTTSTSGRVPAQVRRRRPRRGPGRASAPVTRVTSSPPPASSRSSTSTATSARSEPTTATSPRRRRARRPAGRPGHRQASFAATVTAPSRVAPAAAVIRTTSSSTCRAGSWTAAAASPWTCARVGTTATRRPLVPGRGRRRPRPPRGCRSRSAAAPPPRRAVRRTASSSSPVEGRCPGPAGDDDRPGVGEQRGEPGPGRAGDAARPRRAARPGAGGRGELLGEVGDPDPVRPAGLDARLDRRAGVVDVDVHVPQPAAADDHERVPERARAACAASGRRRRARRAGTSPRRPGRRASRSLHSAGPRRAAPVGR